MGVHGDLLSGEQCKGFSHQTAKVADLKDADLKDADLKVADLKVADLDPLKTNQKKKLIKISTFWGLFKGNLSRNYEEEVVTRFL